MKTQAEAICISCGQSYPLDRGPLTCQNHSPYYGYLTIQYKYDSILGFIEAKSHPWEKYLPLLPISKLQVHLHEKKTPLIKAKNLSQSLGIPNLWIKDEGKNPTGSFKDRESLIAINIAKELGINNLMLVSSGNAVVSTSAYAQIAGIECECWVPKQLSVGKRFLLNLYAAKMKFVDASYEEIYRMAVDSKNPFWNVTPGLNFYKEEGIKLIGFEIWEEIGIPDVIVVPCGNGTLLWGIYKAFWELRSLGLIEKLPKMIGVQVQNASPLFVSFLNGCDYSILDLAPESIAEGIIATESFSSPKVMLALKNTGGKIIEVTEAEVKNALKQVISQESLILEPTSAAAFAGLYHIGNSDQKIVVVNSASGMKNLKEIMESCLT